MRSKHPARAKRLATVLASGLLAGAAAFIPAANAGTKIKVLYRFGGDDGAVPVARLIEDSAGNLYGTTYDGGSNGYGTVFRLARDGTETVLHAFTGLDGDGTHPRAGLIQDEAGNLYSTTAGGGAYGYGTVFKLSPDGTETVLYAFTGGSDGAYPAAGLVQDRAGNLYGTTAGDARHGYGTVFKLAPDGTETVLHAFRSGGDGYGALGGLVRDKAGNLYGTTSRGGSNGCASGREIGCGTVFRVAPDGSETVLYAFGKNKPDGALPYAGLIRDRAGNLYGTTMQGGADGIGTVFKIAPNGTETVLHAFTGGSDGAYPKSDLIQDKAGNLYGTTAAGGGGCRFNGGCGTVFKLAPDGTETVLYAFRNHQRRGQVPYGGLIKGGHGQFYGTASAGGTDCNGFGCGTVFALKK